MKTYLILVYLAILAIFPSLAMASDASVVSDTLARYSWQAESADVHAKIGFIAQPLSGDDELELEGFLNNLNSGICTADNGCAVIVDDQGGTTFSASDNPTGLQALKEQLLVEFGVRPGMQPRIVIPSVQNVTKWNASFSTLAAMTGSVVTILPQWTVASGSQGTLDTFLGNNSITVYGPVGFFSGISANPNKAIEVGMSIDVSGADGKDTATGADGGIALVFADQLAFDAVTHASPLYAAAALNARTRGATRSAITGASSAHFAAVSGTAATVGGNIVGNLGF